MKLSTKTLNWLLLSLGVIILIILLYLLFGDNLKLKIPADYKQPSSTIDPVSDEFKPQTLDIDQMVAQNQIPLDDRGRTEIQLEKEAAIFVERWANLSSQDNFSNLEILKNKMTNKMVDWTNQYIKEQSSSKNNNLYIGTQAKAIVSHGRLDSLTANSFDIEIKIKGQETIASSAGQPKVFYQDYQLTLVKSGHLWLADKLTWQDRQYQ
jgi:hypothetical protein